MQSAGHPARPAPSPAPTGRDPLASPSEAADIVGAADEPDEFLLFLAESTRERDRQIKKSKTDRKHGHARPDDWADPDPRALLRRPDGDHPVDLTIARNKPGTSRNTFTGRVRICCKMLAGSEETMSTEDVRAFPWHHVTVLEAITFRTAVYQRYESQGTRNDVISAVRRIFKECYRVQAISALRLERLLAELWTVAPGPSSKTRRLSQDEINRLMAACESTGTPKARARNTAIIALFRTTGIRVSELANIHLADWDRTAGTIRLRFTKNRRDHLVHVHPELRPYLERWLEHRGTAPGALFSPLTGDEMRSLAPFTILYMLRTRSRAAGVPAFGCHDFRRTFATDLLDSHHDPILVSGLLNHRKLQSTMVYDLRDEEAARSAVATLGLPALVTLGSNAAEPQSAPPTPGGSAA